MRTRRWAEPDWLEEAAAWTRAQLGRVGIEPAGELTLERTRPWAAVARIETSEGRIWFKEPAPSMAFEPALSALVAERRPDDAPRVVAWEGSWILTSCALDRRSCARVSATGWSVRRISPAREPPRLVANNG